MSMPGLIADAHVTFREFLNSPLSGTLEFQVAGEASEGLEAVERVSRLKLDLAVMDIEMPRMEGLEVAVLKLITMKQVSFCGRQWPMKHIAKRPTEAEATHFSRRTPGCATPTGGHKGRNAGRKPRVA
jgi:AmiR/NasT family two-component response regulator